MHYEVRVMYSITCYLTGLFGQHIWQTDNKDVQITLNRTETSLCSHFEVHIGKFAHHSSLKLPAMYRLQIVKP